ncbi:MAG: glutamate-1-semialdehyde 2,1-aminomutase [Peptostreptococcaceae bacterium]|nr:glutamate-1-semialdehyde 2,1-aminomutase [Peptostreptococcaceae bacterium]MDY5738908.1 glutamate-1-semialdehyde 2,1-aminomutase [Anaerovoracaceae bacterium]
MIERSKELFERGKKVMPGGVNSPVRAFGSVDAPPRFIERAVGNKIYDVDGNEYLDYIGSWGPMILGHNDPIVLAEVTKACTKGLSFGACTEPEVKLAELICENIPHVEMIRMVNSGTEAVMSAIRAARGFTGRSKIIKFVGCYHGHSDSLLVKAGSGAMTFGDPDSAGVTKGAAEDTLLASYNNLDSVENLFKEHKNKIACLIVEPVAANMGVVPPAEGFLKGLRQLCDENGALLIFDEVITGFRLAFGGAAEFFGVRPDLVTYGKIIGAGMPVGAYGGRRDIMECVSPLGKVYQAGTLSGNPIAMTAGIAMITQLLNDKSVYEKINSLGLHLAEGLKETGYTVNNVGSLTSIFYTEEKVESYDDAIKADTRLFSKVFAGLLEAGIYVAPSQFESLFVNTCFTVDEIDYTINTYKKLLK